MGRKLATWVTFRPRGGWKLVATTQRFVRNMTNGAVGHPLRAYAAAIT
jgi:hypothetical protein